MEKVNYDFLPSQVRFRMLAEQVYVSAGLGAWCLEKDGTVIKSTCPKEEVFAKLLVVSGCLKYAMGQPWGCSRPLFLSDNIGMMWIAEHFYEEGEISFLTLLGPFFVSKTSMKSVESRLCEYISVQQTRQALMRNIEEVPILSFQTAQMLARMLHYSLTEKSIDPSEFLYQHVEITGEKKERENEPDMENVDRLMISEKMILEAVSDGDLNYQKVWERSRSMSGDSLISSTGETIRDGKISLQIFISQCTRAAIKGGMFSKDAKKKELLYLNRSEACRTMTELASLAEEMLHDFVHQVQQLKSRPEISGEVRESCAYIRNHLLSDLCLQEIADHVGYSEYYFTKKFYKEMGIRVNDYIREKKIEYAKMLMVTTDKSIQTISDMLQFGTRSYFSKVFRESVGVSPAKFRSRRDE